MIQNAVKPKSGDVGFSACQKRIIAEQPDTHDDDARIVFSKVLTGAWIHQIT